MSDYGTAGDDICGDGGDVEWPPLDDDDTEWDD